MSAVKPVAKTAAADPHARFADYYAAREQRRIARGKPSPDWLGRLEAREQIQRKREQTEAMERTFRLS